MANMDACWQFGKYLCVCGPTLLSSRMTYPPPPRKYRTIPSFYMQHGWTALHAAAAKGHARVVETLLKHGANADLPDFHQQLPLMYADFHGHAEVYKLLKEHKASKAGPPVTAKAAAGDNRICAECAIA